MKVEKKIEIERWDSSSGSNSLETSKVMYRYLYESDWIQMRKRKINDSEWLSVGMVIPRKEKERSFQNIPEYSPLYIEYSRKH